MISTLTDTQINQLAQLLGERNRKMQDNQTYLFEGRSPSNPVAAVTVDTTYMLISLLVAGMSRESAVNALREIMWRSVNHYYPADAHGKTQADINIEVQEYLADQHCSGSAAMVLFYAVNLLYGLNPSEHGETVGRIGAHFILNGDIGAVRRATEHVIEAKKENYLSRLLKLVKSI